jgi:hypothetical protein
MMSDLVEHNVPDPAAQSLPIGAVEALEPYAVERDLVRQDAAGYESSYPAASSDAA